MRTIILFLAWLSVSASALSQNLVAYYPFNGNNNDESGNSINPTYTGAGVTLTTDRFGNANKAYNFDGPTGSYMRMPADLLPTTNRTISLWFNVPDVSNRPGLLGYGGNGSCGTTLLLGLNCTGSGQYWVQGHCGTNGAGYTYPTAPVNSWYHWVLTINGSAQKIYVNGELKSTTNSFSGSTAVAGKDFALGVITSINGTAPYIDANVGYLNGKLDDVRIYDAAMTDAQVQSLYANEAMVAYFPFNGNAVDETGNGNNSTYTGTGVTLTTDRFGNANKAYYFDGAVGSYIRVPADKFPTTDRTISFWFNADQLGYYVPTPFSYGGNVCNNSLLMIINHYNYTNSYLVESHCGANVITAPYITEPVNNWYHLTLTISGSTQKIFVNGVLQQSTNSFTSPTYVTGTSALMGACVNTDGITAWAGFFQGKLDEFRIYNTAMTDAQVAALYNVESPDLAAYYQFNGNANDLSGNANNGTLMNGASFTNDRFNVANSAVQLYKPSSQYVNVPNSSSLQIDNELSIAVWVQKNNLGGSPDQILNKGGDVYSGTCNYGLVFSEWTLVFIYNGGYYIVSAPGVPQDFNWHHYAITTVHGSSTVAFYVDGVLKGSTLGAGSNPVVNLYSLSTADLHIGGMNYYSDNTMDEIRIYKRILSVNEIRALADLAPLPVTLLNLQARKTNTTTAQLTWQTATEINNRGFEVQRSFDGNNFTDVKFVNGVGNSDVLKEYSITDIPGKTGRVYYRLKQIDVDGNSKLSKIVSLLFDKLGIIKIYPNPAQQQVIAEGIDNYSRVQVLDATGRLVKDIVNNQQYQLNINLGGLKSGFYFIRLMNENDTQTIKLFISN